MRLGRNPGAGEAGRHRVSVGLEGQPELAIGARRQHPADIEPTRVDRLQLGALLGPQIDRPTMRFPMEADVGHRFQPDLHRGIERREVGPFQAAQEVVLEVADTTLDVSLLVALGDVAGDDLEAVVSGEIEITGIELHRLTADLAQHRRTERTLCGKPKAGTFPDERVTLRQLLDRDALPNVPENWNSNNFD